MFKKEQKHLPLVERSQISLLKTSNFSIAPERAQNRKISSASQARTITESVIENVRMKMKET